MIIFPAIDLRGGRCVRLRQGDFDKQTTYAAEPVQLAQRFRSQGATHLHVVDLDGAKAGAPAQTQLIGELASRSGLRVQCGGGLRSLEHVQALLQAGAWRVVIGSLAVTEPDTTLRILSAVGGERVVLALDVRMHDEVPEVATHGWQSASGRTAAEVLKPYEGTGLGAILCTDIARDGMLDGPNLELYHRLHDAHPDLPILASGGVRDEEDITMLGEVGVAGAVVGKALLDGRVELPACLEAAHAC